MNAYVITGAQNARKSSITRCLTGCSRKNVIDIGLENGRHIQIYVTISSLQEAEIAPDDFIKGVNNTVKHNANCSHVMFCLWPYAHRKYPKEYPDALEYLKKCEKAGWKILKIANLDSRQTIGTYSGQQCYPDARIIPTNITAQGVRKYFEWQ